MRAETLAELYDNGSDFECQPDKVPLQVTEKALNKDYGPGQTFSL